MAVREQDAVLAPPRARTRPDWLDWVLSVGWLLLVAPLAIGAAVLEGLFVGEDDE